MEKTFNHQEIESDLALKWEQADLFTPNGTGTPYSIILPPPNVTGQLHMGHGFQDTLMDALIRYHKMMGYNTLWQAGTDHAGIATQMVVERQLQAEGSDKETLGREAFLEKVWAWKDYSEGTIKSQLKRIGASLDWKNERFTLDPEINAGVNHIFNQLHEEGLIYRASKLVNWDPVLQTAVSDLEVEMVEQRGSLWTIAYPIEGSDQTIAIATTRPETMLGDTAVAVNPHDERYRDLIGQSVRLPITDRLIPIIADDYVDCDFGTGAVKITPAHDFNDYELGKRHELPLINLFNLNGTLNKNAPKAYQGLSRESAREQCIQTLEKLGLLEKVEPYIHQVPHGDRSNAVIEPMLTKQWFMSMKPLAEPAIEAVNKGDIKFTPKNWENTYFRWLEDIQDWCLSRQLWWGHRIPAWYDENGNVYVGRDEQHARQKHGLDESIELKQDEDVLDTWFSSSFWPFITLGWPEKTPRLETFYPNSVLVTGFDIIFFWVARMIMMGLKLTGKVPFKQVLITGLIRDHHGQKMSKSKGNVLDPIDLIQGISLPDLIAKRTQSLMQPQMKQTIIDQTTQAFPEGIKGYGTDALRFTYCAMANTGRDINFDINRLEGYRNFCNKLWNATRFVLMQTEDYQYQGDPKERNAFDHWLLAERNLAVTECHKGYQQFRFDLIAKNLYEFTWQTMCDWALEFSKVTINRDIHNHHDDHVHAQDQANESMATIINTEKYACQTTLLSTMVDIIKMLHPIMPYITEALWQQLAPKLNLTESFIGQTSFPQPSEESNQQALQQVRQLQAIIITVRTIRSEMNLSPKQVIDTIFISNCHASDQSHLTEHMDWLINLCKCQSIVFSETKPEATNLVTKLSGHLEVHVPVTLIDKEKELEKMTSQIKKTTKAIEQCERKLNNPDYVRHAPADIVDKEKEKLTQLQKTLLQHQDRLKLLSDDH